MVSGLVVPLFLCYFSKKLSSFTEFLIYNVVIPLPFGLIVMSKKTLETCAGDHIKTDKEANYLPHLLAFILLSIADVVSTTEILAHGGVEYNPIADNFTETDLMLSLYKTLGVLTIIYFLQKVDKFTGTDKYSRNLLNAMNLVLILVVIKNMTFFIN